VEDGHREYERLIAPIEDRMMRSVWSVTRNADDAEEALQEALCTVWRKLDRISRHPNPEALVLRICINAAYDTLRARIRRRRREALAPIPDRVQTTPEDHFERDAWRRALLDAIGRLSRSQASAVMLRLVQGMSYDQVAEVMGCKASTARKHVERGRLRLRGMLAPLMAGDGPEVTA
jgi:RNA polymerase sigma factor (sigma-70 family)